ncbi:hypothetical protein RCL1_005243 [Eukaryota sp. TZLM3-RCL]
MTLPDLLFESLQRLARLEADLENIEVETSNEPILASLVAPLPPPELSISLNTLLEKQNNIFERLLTSFSVPNQHQLLTPHQSYALPLSTIYEPPPIVTQTSIDSDFSTFLKENCSDSEDDNSRDFLLDDIQRKLQKFATSLKKGLTKFSPKQRFRSAVLCVYFIIVTTRLASSSRELYLAEIQRLFSSFIERACLFFRRIFLYNIQATLEYPKQLTPGTGKFLIFKSKKEDIVSITKLSSRISAFFSKLLESKNLFIEQEKGSIAFLVQLSQQRKNIPIELLGQIYSIPFQNKTLDDQLNEREIIIITFVFFYKTIMKLALDPLNNGVSTPSGTISPFAEENTRLVGSLFDYCFRVCSTELVDQEVVPGSLFPDLVLPDEILSEILKYFKLDLFVNACNNLKLFVLYIVTEILNVSKRQEEEAKQKMIEESKNGAISSRSLKKSDSIQSLSRVPSQKLLRKSSTESLRPINQRSRVNLNSSSMKNIHKLSSVNIHRLDPQRLSTIDLLKLTD